MSGGGLLLLAAAVLWILYLLPTLVHKGREASLSRAATGMSSREAAKAELVQRRLEHKLAHQAELERHRDLALAEAERKAAERAARTAERSAHKGRSLAQTRQRLRLARSAASFVVVVGMAAIVVGVVGPSMNMILWVGQLLVAAGTVFATVGLVVSLNRSRALDALSVVGQQAQPVAARSVVQSATPSVLPSAKARATSRTWTPAPLPAPMHQSEGSHAARAIAAQHSLEELRRRAMEISAESVGRYVAPTSLEAARMAPRPAAAPAARTAAQARPAAAPAAPANTSSGTSRFASMGIVEGAEAQLDVAAILQNRRAV